MSKKSQKFSRPSAFLHSDDWNSRFWVGKMPDYKPRTTFNSGKPGSAFKLPKIQSTNLVRTPEKPESEHEAIHFNINIDGKAEEISEIAPANPTNTKKTPKIGLATKSKERLLKPNKADTKRPKKNLYNLAKPTEVRRSSEKSAKNLQISTSKSVGPHSSKGLLPKISLSAFSMLKVSEEELLNPDEIQELTSESEDSENSQQELIGQLKAITSELLAEGIHKAVYVLASEAVNEALLAYLQLSSNKILYLYIKEVLDEFIPVIAKAAFNESKEKEPSEIRDEIADEVFEEEFWRVIKTLNNHKIAKEIAYEYVKLLSLEGYVYECIDETEKSYKQQILNTFDYLIDSIVEEEWVEILAEDMINSMRIENNWNLLPTYLQKDFGKQQQAKIVETLAERVYFDVLNEVVAGIWVRCICENCLGDQVETLDLLMPMPKFSVKKSSL